MTAVQFRNPEVRLSETLALTRAALSGDAVTLRELLALIGEQGLLVFCAVLAMPFLLPVTLPFMSTVLGVPMLLIGVAVTANRVPWLPERLLDRTLPNETLRHVLDRAARAVTRFEHLVRPRLLRLTASAGANSMNGVLLVVAVLLLMAPLPLVPLGNTLPAVAVILLCLGMTERDGAVVLIGYLCVIIAAAYIAGVVWLAAKTGSNIDDAWRSVSGALQAWF